MKSFHRLKLDIYKVSYRICRPYQEKIDDFYESGKIRFQWDMIRQAYLLSNEQTLPAICSQCPLNIKGRPEGCQMELEELNTFVNVLGQLMPEATILNFNLYDDVLDMETVRLIYNDFLEADQTLAAKQWPVARVCNQGQQVLIYDEDGNETELFYPWDGSEEESYPQGNEAYFWGRNPDGILVKDSFGNRAPFPFAKLYREGYGVYGMSYEGQLHTFIPVMSRFPSWNDQYGNGGQELIAGEMPASHVFKRILDSFILFCEEGMKNNTGIVVEQLM